MLRAVTFDLWETLILEDPEADAPRRDYRIAEIGRIVRAAGIELEDAALEQAHADVFKKMDPYWSSNLDLSMIEQTKMFLEMAIKGTLDAKLPPASLLEAARHYSEAALRFPPKPVQGAAAVLAAIRANGVRIALLCNTGRTPGKVLRDILNDLEMKQYFDVLCFSDEIRLRKPATEFFTRALSRLGVRGDESMHVGDNPETDLKGARSAGMQTVHVRHPGKPAAALDLVDHTITTISELPAIIGKLLTSGARDLHATPPANTPPPMDLGRETRHM